MTEKLMSHGKVEAGRPLSPHLQIYRPMLTMMMSIAHRISGVANAVGFGLLAWWLIALAAGPQQFWHVQAFFASIPGRLLLFLFSWALILHMLGGIRHLIWDTGTALDKKSIEIFAWATLLGSIALTMLLWIAGYCIRGSI
jgi:succinate dehydrogenase / fumarate reductase cytochrome b subunit